MKKLITIMASMATCLLFGDGFTNSGTSFEEYGDRAFNPAKDDAGDTDSNRYWYSQVSDNATFVLTNYVDEVDTVDATKTPTNVVSRPDMFASANNGKYLAIDTDTRLYRSAKVNDQDPTNFSTVDVGVYLDTLVKFTPAEDDTGLSLELNADKIAIAYVENPETFQTNFVVRAGYLDSGSIVQTNYYAAVPDGFKSADWHRLTVRSFASIDAANHVGFVIYLDQDPLEYSTDVDAGLNFTATGVAAKFYDSTVHALFPSAIQSGDFKNTISAVAFTGNGAVDDVTFTTETPNFINAGEEVLATFTADTGVTAISVQVGEAEPIVVDMADLSAILPARTTEFTVTATIDGDNDYAFASMTYGGNTYNSNPATITDYAGGTIAITTTRNNFSLFDENGDPISGTFETLGAALAAQGVAKIQLAYDYTVADADIETYGFINISQSITLDLNGNELDGGKSVSNPLFMVSDGNFVIIDSVGGGKVVYDGPGIVFGATAYIGAANDDLGPTFDGPLFLEGGEGNVIRGKFDETSNTAAGDEPAFLWAAYLGDGDSVESECTGPVAGYWVVAPQSTPEPVVIPTYVLTIPDDVTGASAEVTSNDVVVADLTAIPSNTAVVVTWTLSEGYKLTDGSLTENITMDSNKTAAKPTVAEIQYVTLTIMPVANCTIVVSNATDEVATGTKFDKDDEVKLTVYRTPAEGYELDNCAATETITMDQNQTVTAAVKQSGGDYPSYIPDDPAVKAKYDTWATTYGADTGSVNEDAFLLNCAPADVEAAKEAFKVTITVNPDGSVTVTAPTGYNVEPTIQGKQTLSDSEEWHDKTDGDQFFRAVLSL